MKESLFRFENMEIWQRAADLSARLFKLAEKLDERRYYRFAEQLRAAILSITNKRLDLNEARSERQGVEGYWQSSRSLLQAPHSPLPAQRTGERRIHCEFTVSEGGRAF